MKINMEISSNDAKTDVNYADFIKLIKEDESIVVEVDEQGTRGFGTFVVKVFSSKAIKSFFSKVKDFFGRNEVQFSYVDSSGKKVEFKAKGKDVDPAEIAGFISGNLTKTVTQKDETVKFEYPLELKLGLTKKTDS